MPNIIGSAGLGASVDLLLGTGVDAIWSHVDALRAHACTGLTAIGAQILSQRAGDLRSGIVSFALPNQDTDAIGAALQTRGFICGARSNAVRLSPHGYNTAAEIDGLLDALTDLIDRHDN